MRIKLIESTDIEEMESTINQLLLEGWEKHDRVSILPGGKYYIEMYYYGPRPRLRGEEPNAAAPVAYGPELRQ